ncbi:hypothetical protein [Chryseolinea sp. H1M3-3]|uniref:hypothetical protein n=1 Tax=Chryseolinea sp. H1M3-3 TaxID=3034144 RepID=UPI0023ECE4D8|nr:hypothetical protein [Chryseolinea sp. H1M3-3]
MVRRSIMLTGGEELKGLVKYDNKNGVLSFQDGSDSRVFTAVRIVAFEFFDESLMIQRVFYSFDYEDPQTNVERPLFFEVLKQYKTFAVLSKADQIDLEERTDYVGGNSVAGAPSPMYSTRTVISQTETIYLMKSTGEIKPYFKIIKEEDGEKPFVFFGTDTETKNKMIDRDLLEEFISPVEHEKLRQYALAHDLKFRKKADFLKILDYYDQIVEK